jgi:hypothetical protein
VLTEPEKSTFRYQVQRLLWGTWGFTMHCDKVDAIAVAGREADARHCASLSLLQGKVDCREE